MKQHKLFYGSSYDRGVDILLEMWPQVKEKFPDATLDIAYGWDLFDKATVNNKERQAWKKHVVELMKQDGVTEHGRVSKDKLEEIRQQCGIWTYPTYFTEINCITALEAQSDGLVPVTMTLGALKETAQKGVLIGGAIYKKEIKEKFLKELLDLMGDKKRWEKLSRKCEKFSRKYAWQKIAGEWVDVFLTDID